MNKKKLIRAISVAIAGAMCVSLVPLTGCGSTKDSIVIMTEEMTGLFNPFYATSGTDMDVVGMTQIGMLTTDENGKVTAGDDKATVVKDFGYETKTDETVYTFVIKKGLKFSDGKPLTINDVMFNMYEYLDPVYTGSSTLYSVKIKGLTEYRTQKRLSSGGNEYEENLSKNSYAFAQNRVSELVKIYENAGRQGGSAGTSFYLTKENMLAAIDQASVTLGYKRAVVPANKIGTQDEPTEAEYRQMIKDDYQHALDTFRKELQDDLVASRESFDITTAPYQAHASKLESDVFKFLLYEGVITPKYKEVNGKKDRTVIESFEGESVMQNISTVEQAIEKVYNDKTVEEFNKVLTAHATAGTLRTEYAAAAREVLLRNEMGDTMEIKNIEGIKSLGHTSNISTVSFTSSVSKQSATYNVAKNHNDAGEPTDSDAYDILQITIEDKDPKAIYNFSFTVAPAHYYTADATYPNGRPINIANNEFGVDYASASFQSDVIQSNVTGNDHVGVPVGAGPFMATDSSNGDNPSAMGFMSNNIVYFKKNENFMFDVKADKLRMQVVSSSDAIDSLTNGEVDYITPQFSKDNSRKLREDLKTQEPNSQYKQLDSWQLGYGYIGINAGKITNRYIRYAIMSAMQVQLASDYYDAGTCEPIDWPMSKMNWAYPFTDAEHKTGSKPNNHDYATWTNEADAKAKIRKYMNLARVSAGDSQLNIKFTIAGASITEHPTYQVFNKAKELLNDEGWNVEVKADSQALTKLATGALEVWAAAWGSTIDPDMYQVYHKNSTATSVYAWGYREIKADTTKYSYENTKITELSAKIDEARSYMEEAERRPLYEQALGMVLDLGVELPVYQRKNLYVYNSATVKGFNEEVNPYSSPLEKVWELELVK